MSYSDVKQIGSGKDKNLKYDMKAVQHALKCKYTIILALNLSRRTVCMYGNRHCAFALSSENDRAEFILSGTKPVLSVAAAGMYLMRKRSCKRPHVHDATMCRTWQRDRATALFIREVIGTRCETVKHAQNFFFLFNASARKR